MRIQRITIFLFFLFWQMGAWAQQLPQRPVPPKLINDLTGNFLTNDQAQSLEQKLVEYDNRTSNQIAVVVTDDLQGLPADEYAVKLGRAWGVGNKSTNNGVVLLISTGAKDGKRKLFIAPGYGLEGVITDVVAQSIVDDVLRPNLRAGNNFQAIDQAAEALMKAAEGRYTAPDGYADRGNGGDLSLFKILLIIIIVVIILGIISKNNGGGGYVSRRGYRNWDKDVWTGRRGGGGWWIGGGGGGGGWSGGGGSGGFGGFGGGGFGGGGAGGDW